jgi:hypothetical protein
LAKKTGKNSNKQQHCGGVEAKWYKSRKCYRVWIPARLSENEKACRRFFNTKTEAEKFILDTRRKGLVDWAELAVEEKHVLGVIRQSEKYEPITSDRKPLRVGTNFRSMISDPCESGPSIIVPSGVRIFRGKTVRHRNNDALGTICQCPK